MISKGAGKTILHETAKQRSHCEALADVCHAPDGCGVAISSGSFLAIGMVVVPCSMKCPATMATGNGNDLLTRAADGSVGSRMNCFVAGRTDDPSRALWPAPRRVRP